MENSNPFGQQYDELRVKAAEVAREVVAPNAAKCDENYAIPEEMLRALHEVGLLQLNVPKELDGGGSNIILGTDPLASLIVIEELGRADMGSAHCFQVHSNAVQMLTVAATPEQQERYFRSVVEKGSVISWTATEPGGTARGHYSMQTSATPDGDDLVLNGVKTYATLASVADWNLIHAGLPDLPVPENMIMMMVPKGAKGLEVDDAWWRPLGMRAAVSPRLELKDLRIPAADIIQEPGFYARDSYGSHWHLAFGASHLGAADGIVDFICEYLPKRGTSESPHSQRAIGEMRMAIEAARSLLYRAAVLWEQGDRAKAEEFSLMAKLFAISTAENTAKEAIRVCGSTALFENFPLSRQIRNIHVQSTHANLYNTAQSIGRAQLEFEYDPANQQ